MPDNLQNETDLVAGVILCPIAPTSSVATSTHSVIGASSAHHVVTASARGPVVGTRSLHPHRLPLGFVVGPHLSAAALEYLNVPKSIERKSFRHGGSE